MNKEYLKEKKRILERAEERAQKIIEKHIRTNGYLDGEPWAEEMKKDSNIVLKELKALKEKHEINDN